MASESRERARIRGGPGRPRREAGPALSRESVVKAGLQLVDEEGIDALSMRRLAQQLGVEAMSLYTHVGGKDDLLDAIADHVAAEMRLEPSAGVDWQERIRRAVGLWAGMERAHPRAFPLVYRARAGTDNERAVNEEIMDALAASGLDPPGVALAYQTLI